MTEKIKWRPEGWEERTMYGVTVNNVDLDDIFEAGADAMLEKLRENRIHATPSSAMMIELMEMFKDTDFDKITGWLVFIPEE